MPHQLRRLIDGLKLAITRAQSRANAINTAQQSYHSARIADSELLMSGKIMAHPKVNEFYLSL